MSLVSIGALSGKSKKYDDSGTPSELTDEQKNNFSLTYNDTTGEYLLKIKTTCGIVSTNALYYGGRVTITLTEKPYNGEVEVTSARDEELELVTTNQTDYAVINIVSKDTSVA